MYTLYGIPNCDTCRKARRHLDGLGIAYGFHDLRADGLAPALLRGWLQRLGADVLVNRRSSTWRQLPEVERARLQAMLERSTRAFDPGSDPGPDPDPELDPDAALAALLPAHPTLLKRPLLVGANTCLAGFDAARYNQLPPS